MAPVLRPSTTSKTKASKKLSSKKKLVKLINQGKLPVNRIPGPIRTGVLGWPGPPPIKVPPIEDIYLTTERCSGALSAVNDQLKAFKQEILKLKSKVETLNRENDYLHRRVADLTGCSPPYYPTSPIYSPLPPECDE